MKSFIKKESELGFFEYKKAVKELKMYTDVYKIESIDIDFIINKFTWEVLYPDRNIKTLSEEKMDDSTIVKILDSQFLVSIYESVN